MKESTYLWSILYKNYTEPWYLVPNLRQAARLRDMDKEEIFFANSYSTAQDGLFKLRSKFYYYFDIRAMNTARFEGDYDIVQRTSSTIYNSRKHLIQRIQFRTPAASMDYINVVEFSISEHPLDKSLVWTGIPMRFKKYELIFAEEKRRIIRPL